MYVPGTRLGMYSFSFSILLHLSFSLFFHSDKMLFFFFFYFQKFYLMGLDHSFTSDGGQRQAAFLKGIDSSTNKADNDDDDDDADADDAYDSLELLSIWINVNRPHHYNIAHTHSDCFMSGVYYVTTGRPINDLDPPAALLLSDPRLQVSSTYDYAGWFGMQKNEIKQPKPGKLILFPSWLTHRVEPVGIDEKERISISFNIQLRHPQTIQERKRKTKRKRKKEKGTRTVVEESDL